MCSPLWWLYDVSGLTEKLFGRVAYMLLLAEVDGTDRPLRVMVLILLEDG